MLLRWVGVAPLFVLTRTYSWASLGFFILHASSGKSSAKCPNEPPAAATGQEQVIPEQCCSQGAATVWVQAQEAILWHAVISASSHLQHDACER